MIKLPVLGQLCQNQRAWVLLKAWSDVGDERLPFLHGGGARAPPAP